MSLLALQRDIATCLRADDDATMRRIGDEYAPGLRVYLHNYRAQLIACLEDSFAHTREWIGGEAFHAAMIAHIEHVPPSSWTLDAYPRDFPATLARLYPDDPEIAELAWLEQALAEAFVGPDSPVIDASQLASVDWDRATLRFTATLDHHPLTTNALALWSALEAGTVPLAAELLPEPAAMLVWRYEQISRFRAIETDELGALLASRAGLSFAAMCETLVEQHGEEKGVARAGMFLGHWLGEGLISGIEAQRRG